MKSLTSYQTGLPTTYPANRRHRVWRELRQQGMSTVAIRTEEGRYLPHIIHADEHVAGVAYGWSRGNFVLLVATDRRVIYLDKKPLFIDQDEVTYNVVSGVNFGTVGLGATVVLHTRVKDYRLFTLNVAAARKFVDYIEARVIEQEQILAEE